MSKEKYYFRFRQIIPKPPGQAIACGPYDTLKEALAARDSEKHNYDCEVSIPFTAPTKEEADKKQNNS